MIRVPPGPETDPDRRVPGLRCGAPRTSLYLRPDGLVASCCGSWHILGSVTGPDRRSLREIWDGHRRTLLRDAVDAGDDSLGCWECGRAVTEGRRDGSLAAVFDRYGSTDLGHPVLLDLALSNRCNLECVMCNGGLSSTIRARREGRPPLPSAYDDRFFDELDEFLPHVRRLQFKGGEPFLAPENRRIWDRLLELDLRPEVCVTTNGTVFNDEVARYVEELGMELIVSVDALDPERLRAIRVGVDPERLWANVESFAGITARTGAKLELAMCLMSDNWSELRGVLSEADRRGCAASVIWVDGPARFGLLRSTDVDLAAVADSLDRTDASSPPLRGDLQLIWDDARDRIRSAADGSPGPGSLEESPVRIAGRPGRSEVESVRRSLVEAAGSPEVAELRLDDDVVTAVSAPAWADTLRLGEWVGHGLDEVMVLFGWASGAVVRASIVPGEGGVHTARVHLTGDGGVSEVLTAYVPAPAGGATSWMLLARAGR